jgi:hypothetical protein
LYFLGYIEQHFQVFFVTLCCAKVSPSFGELQWEGIGGQGAPEYLSADPLNIFLLPTPGGCLARVGMA